jgi:hypothetical protein
LGQLWGDCGPKGHAYEADYRREAEAIIQQTFNYRSTSEDRILRPNWKVELESGVVIVRPSYVEFTEDEAGVTVIIKHLHLGAPPMKDQTEDYYALSDLAAERAYPHNRRRIQAMYMSTGETIEVAVPYSWRKTKLQRYEGAMRGILRGDFDARPNNKRCPFCTCYCICPSMESI